VADHSFGVALLAWACAVERQRHGAEIDPSRVVLLALIHDLAEARTGDTPPYDSATLPPESAAPARREFLNRRHVRDEAGAASKLAQENTAMRDLIDELTPALQPALRSLWDELRDGATAEARFVRQIDRLETFLQSRHYLEEAPEAPMESFRQEALDTIDDPLLAAIRDEALGSRP
jgi:putative hydrolase of HD superfamily